MKFSSYLPAVIIGAALPLAIAPTATALTADAVDRIAAQITVRIDGINPGSGVIVGQSGNRYTVLTAQHVVATEDEYQVVTPDGQGYWVDYSTVQALPGVDLALLEFTSDRDYPMATLANYSYNAQFRHVFVSGWPAPQNATDSTSRQLSAGLLIQKNFALAHAKDPLSMGYELFYTSLTEKGMSGGPILDTAGRVIGIHGRAEGETIQSPTSGETVRLKSGFSSGIPIQTFLRQMAARAIPLDVTAATPAPLTASELASIQAAQVLPQSQGSADPIEWANIGNQLYRLEKFPEALSAFDRAIQLDPDFAQAWYGRGQVFYTMGRYQAALDAYDQALRLKPKFEAVWRDRALVLLLMNNPDGAIQSLNRALELNPQDYVAWYLQGNLFRKTRWYNDALRSYDRAVRVAPNFAEAWTGLGRTLYEVGDYPAALFPLARATQANPDLPDAWYWQASVLLAMRRAEEALPALETALQLSPDDYRLWLVQGFALAGLGRYDDAAQSAEQALILKPGDPEVVQFLNAMQPLRP